ncbi:MAG TPA: hypothetical protein VIR82_20225, partial [Bradyrhizobium sp.]
PKEMTMHTRIYWLLPDLESARRTMDDLLLSRIDYRHIHFVAREGTDMSGLHAASLLQTSDVVRSAEMGLIVGAGMGALIGALVAVYYPLVGDEPQWGVAIALAIAGALFGTWTSTMLGVSAPSKRLKRFESQIEQGKILLMVDVLMWRAEAVEERLREMHPEVHLEGTEPDIPAFP